jgi:hypothetical protein
MVIGPHHAAVTHVGDSSEVGQREHMVRQGFTRRCWSEFLCLGGYLAPPRRVGGALSRGMRSVGTLPPSPGGPVAGAPPIGYIHMLTMCDLNHTWLTIILLQVTHTYSCCRNEYIGQHARPRARVAKKGPRAITCAPRRLASPVWQWAHRMAGLERLTCWLTALTCTEGLMHQASWTPSVDRCSLTKRDKMDI